MLNAGCFASTAAIQQWDGQMALLGASWAAVALLHNCLHGPAAGPRLAIDAAGRDCAAAVRLVNLAAVVEALAGEGQGEAAPLQLGGGRAVQRGGLFEEGAAEALLGAHMGASMCGAARLHRDCCRHPACRAAGAAAAAAAAAPPGLIIDGFSLLLGRCSLPGCLREPHARRGPWCLAHALLAHGCRAAAGLHGGPCCAALAPAEPAGGGGGGRGPSLPRRFCPAHAALELPSRANSSRGGHRRCCCCRRCGPAAAAATAAAVAVAAPAAGRGDAGGGWRGGARALPQGGRSASSTTSRAAPLATPWSRCCPAAPPRPASPCPAPRCPPPAPPPCWRPSRALPGGGGPGPSGSCTTTRWRCWAG
jgi:hypothetical protein